MEVWNERRICTEEQTVTVQPNEERDAVVLRLNEINDKSEFRLYLTYDEAKMLAKQINEFVRENRITK